MDSSIAAETVAWIEAHGASILQAVTADVMIGMKVVSGLTWLACLALCIKPAWRIVRRRSRYLDGLWMVVLIGIANRLMFVSGAVPLPISYVAAILLACLLFVVMRSYQHADG